MIKRFRNFKKSLMEHIPSSLIRPVFNFSMALFEAVVVLLIVHIPLVLNLIWVLMGQENTALTPALAKLLIIESYEVGDVLGYSAGLLASSTAYFVVRINYARFKPKIMFSLIFLPMLLLFFAAPVFLRDLDGQVVNASFANKYIITLLIGALIIWIFSLYQQKAISEINEDSSVSNIMKDVEAPQ